MNNINTLLEHDEFESLMDEQLMMPTTIGHQAKDFYTLFCKMNQDAAGTLELVVPFRDVQFYSTQISQHFENCYPTDNFAVSDETCDAIARAVLALADQNGRVY